MNARTRWIVLGVALVVAVLWVLGMKAYIENHTGPSRLMVWTVQPGETLTLSADEVGPDDLYRCPGKGGVNGTPDPGNRVGGSGGLSVSTEQDGTVTVTCEPGPPGNV